MGWDVLPFRILLSILEKIINSPFDYRRPKGANQNESTRMVLQTWG